MTTLGLILLIGTPIAGCLLLAWSMIRALMEMDSLDHLLNDDAPAERQAENSGRRDRLEIEGSSS